MIYFDNAATTRPDKQAIEKAAEYLNENYFNPSAKYKEGFALKSELKKSRFSILSHIASDSKYDLTFTSCGTESDNTAVFGYAKRGNAVSTVGEHSAILSPMSELKNRGIAETRFAPLNKDGKVNVDELLKLVDEKTTLVSVMHVNNETGAINDINKIAKAVKEKNPRVIFHSDGVQGYGKIPYKLTGEVDLYSMSAHKIGGIKGVGALIYNKKLAFKPYIWGGGQEDGKRSGTENVFGIKSFEYAAEKKYLNLAEDNLRISKYKEKLWDLLDKDIFVRLSGIDTSPYILSVSAVGLGGEILLHMSDDDGLIIGTGSACSSNSKMRLSRIILACGYDEKVATGVLRLSFSPLTTEEEIEKAAIILNKNARILKEKTK